MFSYSKQNGRQWGLKEWMAWVLILGSCGCTSDHQRDITASWGHQIIVFPVDRSCGECSFIFLVLFYEIKIFSMYLGVWEKPEKTYEQQQYHLHATYYINVVGKNSTQHINDKYNTKFQKASLICHEQNSYIHKNCFIFSIQAPHTTKILTVTARVLMLSKSQ